MGAKDLGTPNTFAFGYAGHSGGSMRVEAERMRLEFDTAATDSAEWSAFFELDPRSEGVFPAEEDVTLAIGPWD